MAKFLGSEGPGFKGFPHDAPAVRRSAIAGCNWNVLAGDLPLPIALLKRAEVDHNVAWLQRQARRWGIDLAPHGKTTMSPQLFARQLAAGAWGITFATLNQLAVGVAAGVRNALIANQVLGEPDLQWCHIWGRGPGGGHGLLKDCKNKKKQFVQM